ncbi:uncharacterized protein HD556DRAFT_1399571 [Suillus plorans]|uniref:Secreted protein n=1 Tax=Suillus plorans TaxID=116603 RepID=A0A9P7AH31_9AGAM|nr:uncharacterized protein HD556DRAFT_1399571 [Suillus plorans]KAG1789176.1 hypothetical protein HD556DRAFT_1399571 [Suillus plorans]
MRLSFILAVVAAFKLTVSMPVVSDDGVCPIFCDRNLCCPSFICIEEVGRHGSPNWSVSGLTVRGRDPPSYSKSCFRSCLGAMRLTTRLGHASSSLLSTECGSRSEPCSGIEDTMI